MDTAAILDLIEEKGTAAHEEYVAVQRIQDANHRAGEVKHFRDAIRKLFELDDDQELDIHEPKLELEDGTILQRRRFSEDWEYGLERVRICNAPTCNRVARQESIVFLYQLKVPIEEDALCDPCFHKVLSGLELGRARIREDLEVLQLRAKETPSAALVALAQAALHLAETIERSPGGVS